MENKCIQCGGGFFVDETEKAFYEKISPVFDGKKYLLPVPKLCPDCRQQQRVFWRKERNLYYRTCSKTGKKILSMYPQEVKFPVFDNDVWWGDSWDGKDYGRDFDFSRAFFEQFMELRDQVPHFALAVSKPTMQNSDFCNQAGYLKDCYLIFNSDRSEKCFYGKGVNRCFDCVDCYKVYESEACYECMNCHNCKFDIYLWDSQNTSESRFCANLIGCSNCFFCVNLQNKKYCFLNKQYSAEEWKKKVAEILAGFTLDQIFEKFVEFKITQPMKWMDERNTENCTGNYLVNCKDCEMCFDAEYLEKCRYCYDIKRWNAVSFENYDVSAFGMDLVSCYQGVSIGYCSNHVLFGIDIYDGFDLYYCMLCMNNCKNCFGCIGLKKGEYCILNKQYTKEEYGKMVARIVEHMQKTGEFGRFFPVEYSPFAYNEVTVSEYFPMSREGVLKQGWKWCDPDENDYKLQTYKVPEKIQDVGGEICDQILACKATGKNFKIQKLELDFYRKMKLLIPKYCPDYRHMVRVNLRNPRKLWSRNCQKCGMDLRSSYALERPEKIYCGKCYQQLVY